MKKKKKKKKVVESGQASTLISIGDESEYEVESILQTRKREGKVEYLVSWVGYGEEGQTWELHSDVQHNAKESIKAFKRKMKEQANPKAAEEREREQLEAAVQAEEARLQAEQAAEQMMEDEQEAIDTFMSSPTKGDDGKDAAGDVNGDEEDESNRMLRAGEQADKAELDRRVMLAAEMGVPLEEFCIHTYEYEQEEKHKEALKKANKQLEKRHIAGQPMMAQGRFDMAATLHKGILYVAGGAGAAL